MKEKDFRLKPQHSFSNVELIKKAVQANMGFSIIPLSTIKQETESRQLIYRYFPDKKICRKTNLVFNKSNKITPEQKIFFDFAENNLYENNNSKRIADFS